jgi:hypothetical protein
MQSRVITLSSLFSNEIDLIWTHFSFTRARQSDKNGERYTIMTIIKTQNCFFTTSLVDNILLFDFV